MADWTEKYRPRTLSEVRGNDKARDALEEWARTWDDHREAVVVHGSPGVGKTSAAHALATDMGWDVIELNASDQRTADVIERVAGRAARNATIGGAMERARRTLDPDDPSDPEDRDGETGRQLIVLDEADNVHHQKDYGGQAAITELVREAGQPIVLIANDYYDLSRGLRGATREIEFRDVSKRSILPVLRDLCRREGVEYEDGALDAIAEANSGDLRGAINDLQAVCEPGGSLVEEDVVTGARDRTRDIWTFLDAVLKEGSAEEALRTTYDVDETPDSLVQWIEDKAPMVYEGEELARAYGFLANADRWLGRTRATQRYTYWRYANDNLAAGVAAARDHDRGGWTRYGGPPFRSSSDATRDRVARRIAEGSGVSMSTARRAILPYLEAMTHHCRNRELTLSMTAAYDLDAEHVSFVTGSGKETNKVQSIVEDARELREALAVEHSGGAFEGAVRTVEDDDGEAEVDRDDTKAESEVDGDDRGEATDEGGDGDEAADAEEPDRQSGLGDFA